MTSAEDVGEKDIRDEEIEEMETHYWYVLAAVKETDNLGYRPKESAAGRGVDPKELYEL